MQKNNNVWNTIKELSYQMDKSFSLCKTLQYFHLNKFIWLHLKSLKTITYHWLHFVKLATANFFWNSVCELQEIWKGKLGIGLHNFERSSRYPFKNSNFLLGCKCKSINCSCNPIIVSTRDSASVNTSIGDTKSILKYFYHSRPVHL